MNEEDDDRFDWMNPPPTAEQIAWDDPDALSDAPAEREEAAVLS